MQFLIAVAILAVAVGATVVADDAKQESPLDGVWVGGYSKTSVDDWTIEIQDGQFSAQAKDQSQFFSGPLRVHATEPPGIDFEIDDCECKYRGQTSRGVYELDGERLKIGASPPGESRPPGFREEQGEVLYLTRQPPS
jgi:uncharacterized protein (TIGR03067 family)